MSKILRNLPRKRAELVTTNHTPNRHKILTSCELRNASAINKADYDNSQTAFLSVHPRGFEQGHERPGKIGSAEYHSAHSSALAAISEIDADLAVIAEAWPTLTTEQRQAILAIVAGPSQKPK